VFSKDLAETGIAGNSTATSSDGMFSSGAIVLKIALVNPIVVGDDGGWEIELTGSIPTTKDYFVDIYRQEDPDFEPQRCYSGIVGRADICKPDSMTQMRCWVPPLPIDDNYDIHVYSTDGLLEDALFDELEVIHRSFVTNLYRLREHWPPPRDVGPYEISDED
jgi:hypothetical protein